MGFYKIDKSLQNILQLNKIYILEDLAQSCIINSYKFNYSKYDKTIYLFSLNKILPVTDGAFLASNNSDIINNINIKRSKPNFKSISYYLKHINNNKKSLTPFHYHQPRNIL